MKRLLLLFLALAPALSAQLVTFGRDPFNCTAFTGWAYNPQDLSQTLTVELWRNYDQGLYVASAVANEYRWEGQGYHGFTIPFPPAFKDGLSRPYRFKVNGVFMDQSWLTGACSASGGYAYYSANDLDPSRWSQNGSLSNPGPGLGSSSATGGSWISNVPVPDLSSDYEVKLTLNLQSSGGTYAAYLRASADAMSGSAAQGTFYSVELQNPTFTGNVCSATLALNKRDGGVFTSLAAATVPCRPTSVLRVVRRGSLTRVFLDGVWYLDSQDNTITAGQPGVGAWSTPASSGVARVDLGQKDVTAPSPVNPQSVAVLSLPNRVDLRWQGVADDANGVGAGIYSIYRNGAWFGATATPELSDSTVAPSTTYTYVLYAGDYHANNSTSTTISVTTPPAGAIDPRRIGVHSTGAYWGAGGEQIDTRSGNLNFTLPLLNPLGRGGWSVPIALSYNSQIWRRENSDDWNLDSDVGYGVGWRLQAGSLTPFWSGQQVHHYLFTDSTGAEYRLDQYASGLWTTHEGLHLEYDETNYRLYFPDGSSWYMGCVSAGTERDAGTRYPTILRDTNGNVILFRYYPGVGVPWPDSSSRLKEIEDVRARTDTYGSVRYRTYTFQYTSDPVLPHLTSITNHINTAENYTFTYSTQNLYSPFAQEIYGGAALLTAVTANGLNIGHAFEYQPISDGSTGELTRVVLPHGGALRWTHRSFTYTGSRSLREVQYRYLLKASGAAETTYSLGRDDAGDAARSFHAWTQLVDPTTNSKVWGFDLASGFLSYYDDRKPPNDAVRRQEFTWSTDPSGNPYISAILTTADPGTAYQKQSKTEQTLDAHGNVTQTRLYGFDSLTTPIRTFTHTYLATAPYTSRHIFNRRLTTTVTNGTQTVTLASNTYDSTELTTPYGDLREHDANFNSSFTYRGNLTRVATPGAVRNIFYDTAGNAIRSDDNNNHRVDSAVTGTTNFTVPDRLTPNTTTELSTALTYNSFLGVTSATGPNQSTTSATYDSYGRVTSATSPHGAVTTTSYAYNPTITTVTTNSRITRTYLDGLGRTVKVETGDSTSVKSVVETEYDACACSPLGKVKRVSRPYAPGATVYWTAYTYDALGRTLTVTAPDNSVTSYLYQGAQTTLTDPAGKWKRYTRDAMGNLVQVTEPAPEGGTHETYYAYNLLNQMTTVTMPRPSGTQTRTFNYDLTTARLTSATNPETGTVSYTYRTDGRVATKTDARNVTVTYSYDTYGRLTGDGEKTYVYDVNPYTSQTYWGKLAAAIWNAEDMEFAELYQYGPSGLLAAKTVQLRREVALSTFATRSLTATFAYDNEGQYLGPATYPGDDVTSYTYPLDTLGRPTGVHVQRVDSTWNANWVWNVAYNPAGAITQLRLSDNSLETRTYNALGQMTRLTAQIGANPPLQDLEYRYTDGQNNGRIAQMKDWVTGEEVNYAYDTLNRLTQASTTGPEYGLNYSYDGFGNMTNQTLFKGSGPTTNLTYNAATNRISTPGYQFDAAGNMTATPALPSYSLWYDAQNRLTYAGTGANFEYYGYDPRGQRLWMRGPDYTPETRVWNIFFYGADGQRIAWCWASFTNDGSPYTDEDFTMQCTSQEIRFGGRLVREHSMPIREGDWNVWYRTSSTQHPDRLHSRGRHYPYGEPRVAGQNPDEFATYPHDGLTGFHYANQRYYNPATARFNTADPYDGSAGAEDPQSWNRYAYVGGDPINLVDPTGLEATPTCGDRSLSIAETGELLGTVASLAVSNQNWTNLGVTMYVEGPGGSMSIAAQSERRLIGMSIMNRWQVVNGYYTIFAPDPKVVVPDWGEPDGSIWSILTAGNGRQYATWTSIGLEASAQERLDHALNSGPYSEECYSLVNTLSLAQALWINRNLHQLYEFEGLIVTSFNSFGRPSHPWEIFAGRFSARGNAFYGAPYGSFVWHYGLSVTSRRRLPRELRRSSASAGGGRR